ncbi:MAG TPA: hypothetical protein VIT44_15725 [Cyclobacteriaceae bacterium]
MKQIIKHCLQISTLLLSFCIYAQLPSNRVKPGTMYEAGHTVRSPRLGLTTQIPDGWAGVLPRDAEVFLLLPQGMDIGEIYVILNENINLQEQRQRWEAGMTIDGVKLETEGAIGMRGSETLAANAKLTGTGVNKQSKIYLEAKCSPAGFCLTFVLTAEPSSFHNVKRALQEFVDNTSFGQPTNESPYINFDWKKFLSGKILLASGYENNSKRENEVSLCADGTFRSDITRTGIFKDQAKGYQGNKTGNWSVKSDGEKATITLTFKSKKKLAPFSVELVAKDEHIYINGQRYFIGESDACR